MAIQISRFISVRFISFCIQNYLKSLVYKISNDLIFFYVEYNWKKISTSFITLQSETNHTTTGLAQERSTMDFFPIERTCWSLFLVKQAKVQPHFSIRKNRSSSICHWRIYGRFGVKISQYKGDRSGPVSKNYSMQSLKISLERHKISVRRNINTDNDKQPHFTVSFARDLVYISPIEPSSRLPNQLGLSKTLYQINLASFEHD